eukprot:TRINITY_DN75317_c0_g1_i1.p1 TRINITY_DN75317_c0_g1~~TRINITY_DN75317_c0_g1_i1.p1  ORF type:complete len:186 (+),score=23.62 TRINITY_DN75317_c0_g1_i1:58-615(+)
MDGTTVSSTTITTGFSPQAKAKLSALVQFRLLAANANQKLHDYIDEEPHRLNFLSCIGGVGCVLVGLYQFAQATEVIEYVVTLYQVLFGIVTFLAELHPRFTGPLHGFLEEWQTWIHDWAMGLTLLWGRGLFYIFQGSLAGINANTILSPGTFASFFMCILGLVCFYRHWRSHPEASTDVYVRAP